MYAAKQVAAFQYWCIKYTQLTLQVIRLLFHLPADKVLLYLLEMWMFRGCLSSCQPKGCKVFQKKPLLWKQLLMHGSLHDVMCTNLYPNLRFTAPYYGMFEALSSLELNKMVPLWNRVYVQQSRSKSVCFHITPAVFAPEPYLKMFPCPFWNKHLKSLDLC